MYFKPEGLIEQEIIDDLVFNRLHKRRIDTVMTREFSKATVEKAIELRENKERPVARYWLRLASVLDRHSFEPAERVRPDICIWALEQLIEGIGNRGPQPQDLELLRLVYGDQPTEHAALMMHLLADAKATQKTEKPEDAAPRLRKLKESLLNTLRAEIEAQKDHEALEITSSKSSALPISRNRIRTRWKRCSITAPLICENMLTCWIVSNAYAACAITLLKLRNSDQTRNCGP
ncbi:MAG: hypothetical protein WBQ04_00445 [Candidatus Acidiferrales bacterium]